MRLTKAVFLFTCLAFATGSLATADQRGVTWLAFSTVNPGMSEDAVAYVREDEAVINELMADGTILGWGLATRASHLPGDPDNFVQWVTLPNWDSVDKWVGRVFQMMSSKSPEEMAAAQEKASEIFVEGSHHDIVADDLSWGSPESGRYIYVGQHYAGDSAGFMELYLRVVQPIGEKLVADGLVNAFGIHSPSLHTGDGWTHTTWMLLPGLAAIDAYHEAIRAALTPETMAEVDGVTDMNRHQDSLWMVLHSGGGGGSADDAEVDGDDGDDGE